MRYQIGLNYCKISFRVISGPCKGYVSGNFGMIMVYMSCKVDLLGLEVSYRVDLLLKCHFRVISGPLWPILGPIATRAEKYHLWVLEVVVWSYII